MKSNYIYTGCFLPLEKIDEVSHYYGLTHLDQIVQNPHMTVEFRPRTVDESLFGEEVRITLVGYGNDTKNEGFKVVAHTKNAKLQQIIEKVLVPHITISTSRSGKPIDTGLLDFSQIKPVTLLARYGAYNRFGQVITTPDVRRKPQPPQGS